MAAAHSVPLAASPHVHSDAPGFWGAVRAEVRATWGGRFRWLWRVLALGVQVWVSFTRDLQWLNSSWTFMTLCGLACWGAAWLCADLLSVRFKGNPDPLREWRPVEFLARAVGR